MNMRSPDSKSIMVNKNRNQSHCLNTAKDWPDDLPLVSTCWPFDTMISGAIDTIRMRHNLDIMDIGG